MGAISIIWVIVGFSLAFGESYYGVIGNPFTFFMLHGVDGATNETYSPTFPFLLFAIFDWWYRVPWFVCKQGLKALQALLDETH